MKVDLNKRVTYHDSEETIFRNMSQVLSQNYHVHFIGTTHNQKVKFHSTQIGGTATREISDLWIIAFSPKKMLARMTFLQAKKNKEDLHTLPSTFKGEYFQFELLSKRPILKQVIGKKFNFPPDILSFACCSSIGSFGVFYLDNNGDIDMAYCSAKFLKPINQPPKNYKQSIINLQIPRMPYLRKCGNRRYCDELVRCTSINRFTQNLLSLKIGAEFLYQSNISGFVASTLANFRNDPVVNQLCSLLNTRHDSPQDMNEQVSHKLLSNLLIINTDEKETPNDFGFFDNIYSQ